jgi:DNA-binding NtrC family response regulator/tetratricopeptide (TPR) repeat protein
MRREALNEIAILYAEQRNWDGALRAFEEMESFARGLSDRTGVLEAVFNRAVIHYKRHDLDRAEDLFREARRISEEFGTHVLAPTVWLGLAGVFRERGSLLEAMRLYRRLLRSDTSLSRPNDSCVAHSNLAEIHLVLGRLDRALRHVHVARRLARSTRSRFAFTLAVRVSGMVHWALGADSRAQRDLEKALAMAREAGDSRGQGMAEHYLGRLASVRGHTAEAFRRLRRGTASSRSASDRVHLHAGVLALLAELVALGRRSGPARLLESYATKKTGWARGDLLARVLAEELDDAWPENSGRVEVLCQQAAREGSVWDAFCALGEALRGPRLPAATSQALAFQRDRLAMSILRRVPARHVRGFLRFWKLPPELAPSSLAGEAGEDPLERNPPRREAASGPSVAGPLLLVGETLEPLAESTSLALETALDVSLGRSEALALGILFDPHLDDKACTFRGRGEHSLSSLSGRHAEAITRARGSTRIVESPPFLFHRLAHPKAARVLCGEFRVIDARARQSLRDAATFMALAIRLAELHRDLAHERARHGDARDELRRLNTLAVKGSLQELETAVMTQRIELLDLKQKLLERQEELRKAHRRPAAPPPASASPAMKRILEGLPAMAARDLPVLILGESGVGKDVLARWIHELGPRREKPYISEVANLVESLAEAELFGFAAGAFTGAVDDRPGILELARGGTVYLDEIATLPPAIQGKLLRVLEEKRVRPIGAEESVSVDFRLLSSSRHTLAELQGLPGLRQDLLYRVNAEVVEVPPLRERPEDILALTDQFIDDCCHESGQQPPYMHEEVRDRLLEHSWPGNVRELRNEIQRLLATRPPEITAEMLRLQARPVAPAMGASGAALPTLRQERSRVEERLLRRALESSGGNASAASRRLGITRRYLGTLLRKHRIRLGTKTGKAGPRRNDQL